MIALAPAIRDLVVLTDEAQLARAVSQPFALKAGVVANVDEEARSRMDCSLSLLFLRGVLN